MFKLPVCPHCGTVYRYKDTKQAIRNKENECYHCHKRFKTKFFPYILVEVIILLTVSIGANLLILSRLTNLTLVPLFAVTLVLMLLAWITVPFFTHFKKTEPVKKKTAAKKKK